MLPRREQTCPRAHRVEAAPRRAPPPVRRSVPARPPAGLRPSPRPLLRSAGNAKRQHATSAPPLSMRRGALPPSDAEGPPAPPQKKSGGHGTSPVAHKRLAVCRGQPPPDCRQRPKMGASRSQVPLAAGLLDGSEGAALRRAKRMAIVWPTATSTTPDAGHREQ